MGGCLRTRKQTALDRVSALAEAPERTRAGGGRTQLDVLVQTALKVARDAVHQAVGDCDKLHRARPRVVHGAVCAGPTPSANATGRLARRRCCEPRRPAPGAPCARSRFGWTNLKSGLGASSAKKLRSFTTNGVSCCFSSLSLRGGHGRRAGRRGVSVKVGTLRERTVAVRPNVGEELGGGDGRNVRRAVVRDRDAVVWFEQTRVTATGGHPPMSLRALPRLLDGAVTHPSAVGGRRPGTRARARCRQTSPAAR